MDSDEHSLDPWREAEPARQSQTSPANTSAHGLISQARNIHVNSMICVCGMKK